MIDIIKNIMEELEIIKRERGKYQGLLEEMIKRWTKIEAILSLEIILDSKSIEGDNFAKYLYVEEEVIVDEVKFIKDKIDEYKIDIKQLKNTKKELIEEIEKLTIKTVVTEGLKQTCNGQGDCVKAFDNIIEKTKKEIVEKQEKLNFINWTMDWIIEFEKMQ